jgi:bifunctional DNA-binding transcriptional regulator/antitoxin component of YhaV-PrlF toxin-antitoxin module
MSSVLVKLQKKGQMVIPRNLRDEAGVSEGALLKIAVIEGGQFLVTPQVTVDRSLFTRGAKHLTSAQVDLAEIVAELRKDAKQKGLDAMTGKEINRAVAAARKDLKKKDKHPAK